MILLLPLMGGGLATAAVVFSARWITWWFWRRQLVAYRMELPRGLTHAQVSGWLGALGAATRHIPVVIEIDADSSGIRHFLLVPRLHARMLLNQVRSLLPGVRSELAPEHLAVEPVVRAAGEVRLTSASHPLGHERAASMSAAFLAALQPLAPGQRIRVSWLLSGTTTPHPASTDELSPDLVRFRRAKHRAPLLRASGRISITGTPPRIARALLYRVYSTMRVLDAPGAALVRRVLPWRVVASRVRDRSIPLTLWPTVLNTDELAGLLGIPFDGTTSVGLALSGARQLPPSPDFPRRGLVLARSNYPGLDDRPLAIRQEDRLKHLWLLGPTGTGKSTLIANMAVQDARAGYGLVVVDPKSDLVDEILARLPDERRKDVIVLNPAATDRPIGFNVLHSTHDEHSRELVADNVVRIFAEVWKSSFGPRTTDVLRNALLTLTATRAANGMAYTLAEVAPLLENPAFRRSVTSQPTVPPAVRSFWQAYEVMSAGERGQTIAPSLNKLRALTTRTSLQLMLGQSTGFEIGDVFTKRRILLVSLNKGVVGSETAALLGSLLVASLWNATLKRAEIAPAMRRPVWAYLDEFQDVLRIGGDIADALSQARALGLGLILAHQYLGQLPPALQTAVISTVRSSVTFQLDRDDARTLAPRFLPQLTADDLMGTRAYEAVLRLCIGGQTRPPVTGHTLPLDEPTQDALALAGVSRMRFGAVRADVEAELHARIAVGTPSTMGRSHGARA